MEFITHSNCCYLLGGALLKNGQFAFVMGRYSSDLRTVIDNNMKSKKRWYRGRCNGPFKDMAQVICIKLDIAYGMKTLHKHGILHRDLKAVNILVRKHKLTDDYTCDVADFESSVGIYGSGFWRAPELLEQAKINQLRPEIMTKEVDVYSYAMTYYEILTGKGPFEDEQVITGAANLRTRVMEGARPPLPSTNSLIDERVRELVEACWHQEPSKWPSFKQIVERLSQHQNCQNWRF